MGSKAPGAGRVALFPARESPRTLAQDNHAGLTNSTSTRSESPGSRLDVPMRGGIPQVDPELLGPDAGGYSITQPLAFDLDPDDRRTSTPGPARPSTSARRTRMGGGGGRSSGAGGAGLTITMTGPMPMGGWGVCICIGTHKR